MTRGPIVIIGGSAAGLSAAQALAEAGYPGKITLVSAEPYLPYKRTKVSKSFAAGFGHDAFTLQDRSWYEQHQIELVLGKSVTALDLQAQQAWLADGVTLPWERLILATGAAPRRLLLPRAVAGRIHYATTKAQVEALRRDALRGSRVLVVGTGVLGIEVADQLRLMDRQVTVAGEDPVLMSRELNSRASRMLAGALEQGGVELLLGQPVGAMALEGEGISVELPTGRRTFDAVVSCIGMIPKTRLARQAGLAVGQGARVDLQLRTSHPRVYAAGDVAELPDRRVTHLWRHALHQGRVAGLNAGGASEVYRFSPFRLKCKVFGCYYFSLGRPAPEEASQFLAVEQQEGRAYRCCYYQGESLAGLVMCNDEPNGDLYNTAVVERWDRQRLERESGWSRK